MDYFSLKKIRKKLNINPKIVEHYIASGKIKTKKIGEEYFIPKSDFDKVAKILQINKTADKKDLKNQPKNFPNQIFENEEIEIEKRHRHLQIFSGINSDIMETIMEMSGEIPVIGDLKKIIREHAKDCLVILNKIEKEGVTDIKTAINLLLIDEAIKNLTIRRNLFMRLIKKNALILLPLPPHLSNAMLTVAHHDFVLVSDNNLPPHLRHTFYKNLDFILPKDLDKLTKKNRSNCFRRIY